MTFDLDYSGAYEQTCGLFFDKVLPWASWAVERQSNGHAHFTYTLATPVLRTARARPKPPALLARISGVLPR